MTATTAPDQTFVEAIARSAVYELCVRTLSYPSDAHDAAIGRLAQLLDGVWIGSDATTAAIADVLAEVARADREDVVAHHNKLFTLIESRDCPPYESAYESRDVFRMTDIMSDVAGFYGAHGLVIGGIERERPDHILAECEFMSFLATKEAVAMEAGRDEDAEECRRSAAVFLRDHLGRFAEAFGARTAVCAPSPLHAAAGRLLSSWIPDDMVHLGVEAELLHEPLPPPEQEEDACGSCASPCPVDLGPGR
ncbi:MAG: molecular chaperone TorD family protein [Acidimicrobiia bacterium]|nr:molecular chaperone TorD family protein [Acidimicrobiia bacterium]